MTSKRPNYRVGYCLDDDLQVTTEVRAYVAFEPKSFIYDPNGHLDGFLETYNSRGASMTLHSTDYFYKDDNNLIRAKHRSSEVVV